MKISVLLVLCVFHIAVFGQTDTLNLDEIVQEEEYAFEKDEVVFGIADSVQVEARSFAESKLQELKNDSGLDYEQPPTIAESLWDRFLMLLSQFFNSLFNTAVHTDWGRVFLYLLGLAVLVLIVMLVLKVDAFKVFYSAEGASTIKQNVFDENIHEIDFEKEVQAAVDMQDYRRGVRLLFLYALKILSDKQYILWERGKTNHEYVDEVKDESLRNWLNDLSYYFDYAWYGNFQVSKDLFEKVNHVFSNWKSKVR